MERLIQKLSLETAGRALVGLLFLAAGIQKLVYPEPVVDMLEALLVPAALVWLLAVINLLLAAFLMAGWQTRIIAIVIACYCLVSSIFHFPLLADPWQITIILKNWAIAGAMLMVASREPTPR